MQDNDNWDGLRSVIRRKINSMYKPTETFDSFLDGLDLDRMMDKYSVINMIWNDYGPCPRFDEAVADLLIRDVYTAYLV